MAHFAGLVARDLYPNPFPHAHLVTTSYKSLRGARGGVALWNDERLSNKINHGIFPGVRGSALTHGVACKAACFGETLRPEFIRYNQSVLDNAHALAGALRQRGLRIVSGGTDTGLTLVDLGARNIRGAVEARTAARSLARGGVRGVGATRTRQANRQSAARSKAFVSGTVADHRRGGSPDCGCSFRLC